MKKSLQNLMNSSEVSYLTNFLFSLPAGESGIILSNDLTLAWHEFSRKQDIILVSAERFLTRIQEIIPLEGRLVMVYRLRKASCRIYELRAGEDVMTRMEKRDFLAIKERLIKPDLPYDQRTMVLDLAPFYDYGPSLKDPESIGQGIRHLNRYMSANLANQPEKWNITLYEFLKLHQLQGVQLLLDGSIIKSVQELESALEDVVYYLGQEECPECLEDLKKQLRHFGFLEGWGNSPPRILETLHLLQEIIEQPNETALEEFLSRIPMVSKVVLVSPHGWFGQENVLGRPDTGGQVVYVLDQARAMEQYLKTDLQHSGLDIQPKVIIVTRLIPVNEGTTSDQRLEKVHKTQNVWILRVPFRYPKSGGIVEHWISRFRIWPYLDQFAVDAEVEILKELAGLPDLLVGNYSDGNLVATRLSASLGVTQCNIAHALEKSKYLFSDLYWENFEPDYNFSIQFMADLIAMNSANFIISSTSQEITGTDNSIGQYESYQFFTMPGLLQVVNGVNLFHPRFNVIPPGVSNDVFFPFNEKKQDKADNTDIQRMLFETEDENSLGNLQNPELPPIFSIARLDRIKNLTGLVEAYGKNQELRSRANLIIIASVLNPDLSNDAEEAAEIQKMHDLINQYDLRGSLRWVGRFLSKDDSGEVYRIIARRRGIFVQPALFEAFGLTILEAMHSGLPVFATRFGGPQEIIEDGKSGFLINPTQPEVMVGQINEFWQRVAREPGYWDEMSANGLRRAQTNFTWDLHCRRLTRLTKVYGFWRYSISGSAKSRLAQYCHLLYHLYFKARAAAMPGT
ncbi:MAG: sucrose synthase [Deltaproteobacteria bacterium]|nr:sucrose synthase [Deltaproteobacteria bacterium]